MFLTLFKALQGLSRQKWMSKAYMATRRMEWNRNGNWRVGYIDEEWDFSSYQNRIRQSFYRETQTSHGFEEFKKTRILYSTTVATITYYIPHK